MAAFFYLRVIVLMYFSEPGGRPTVTVPGAFTTAAITLGVAVTLLLGLLPAFALDWADAAPSPLALSSVHRYFSFSGH